MYFVLRFIDFTQPSTIPVNARVGLALCITQFACMACVEI